MRTKIIAQPELNFDPPTLKITQEFHAKYERISELLDANPEILDRVHADLELLAGPDTTSAEARYASDMVLRLCVCQVIEGLSLRETIVRVDTCAALRRFVRVYGGAMMDYSTFCRLRNGITSSTWERINRVLAAYAVAQGFIQGEALRVDTTAVETNIHWPTDSSLLVDVFQTIKRDLDRARRLGVTFLESRRFHEEAVRKLGLQITRKSGRKGGSSKDLKPQYKRLMGHISEILDVAQMVAESLRLSLASGGPGDDVLAARLLSFEELGRQIVSQAHRRVILEESVPNEEKLFSIFEPHTELLKRGKAGKPIEFGHMIQIEQVAEKFITGYGVYEKKPVEPGLLEPALATHRSLFGHDPNCLAADKGYFEKDTVEKLRDRIPTVSIGKKGKRTPEETEHEHDPFFRFGQRFRAGVEGTISFLKRVLGMSRCFVKGWAHYQAAVGTSIFAHNLLILARC